MCKASNFLNFFQFLQGPFRVKACPTSDLQAKYTVIIWLLECEEGWSEFAIGYEAQCWKIIGNYTFAEALGACNELGAGLPGPMLPSRTYGKGFIDAVESMQESTLRFRKLKKKKV